MLIERNGCEIEVSLNNGCGRVEKRTVCNDGIVYLKGDLISLTNEELNQFAWDANEERRDNYLESKAQDY